jgi:hypothetical protein
MFLSTPRSDVGNWQDKARTTLFEKEQNTPLSTGYCPRVETVLISLCCSTAAQIITLRSKNLVKSVEVNS